MNISSRRKTTLLPFICHLRVSDMVAEVSKEPAAVMFKADED